jgi:hypothetical protein
MYSSAFQILDYVVIAVYLLGPSAGVPRRTD